MGCTQSSAQPQSPPAAPKAVDTKVNEVKAHATPKVDESNNNGAVVHTPADNKVEDVVKDIKEAGHVVAHANDEADNHHTVIKEKVIEHHHSQVVDTVDENNVHHSKVVDVVTTEIVTTKTEVIEEIKIIDNKEVIVEKVVTTETVKEVTTFDDDNDPNTPPVILDSTEKSGKVVETTITTAKVTPAMKKGYILKQGHVRKNWKNRYFVLDAGKLTYYESSSPTPPYGVNSKGEVSLKDMEVAVSNYVVQLTSNGKGDKELFLEIKNLNERNEWVDAFNKHIAYYN